MIYATDLYCTAEMCARRGQRRIVTVAVFLMYVKKEYKTEAAA